MRKIVYAYDIGYVKFCMRYAYVIAAEWRPISWANKNSFAIIDRIVMYMKHRVLSLWPKIAFA